MPDTPTCPNCGYGFPELRRATRMFDCPACGTTLFREADALAPVGDHGEMHAAPMLFGLGDTVSADGMTFLIIGHARFDYGRGFWDEMWAEDARGHGAWLSLDEGDVALQFPLIPEAAPRFLAPPPLGTAIDIGMDRYVVTESDAAALVAIRGEFPERLDIGERHRFVNASGNAGRILSGEFWEGGQAWFEGRWIDPFDVTVERAA
jgi:hypothetical protein